MPLGPLLRKSSVTLFFPTLIPLSWYPAKEDSVQHGQQESRRGENQKLPCLTPGGHLTSNSFIPLIADQTQLSSVLG